MRRFDDTLAPLCLALGLLTCWSSSVLAQDEAIVVEESETSTAGPIEAPRRVVDGRKAFIRPFAEAFDDPDQRMNLEPKYYFLLSDQAAGDPFDVAAGDNFADGVCRLEDPRTDSSGSAAPEIRLNDDGELVFTRTLTKRGATSVLTKKRPLPAAPNPLVAYPLDAHAGPQRGAPGAGLLGDVIAVLIHDKGRFAVEFYSASLDAESDRRLWLSESDGAVGRPLGICFCDIPIQGANGLKTVSVISVLYPGRWVAYDFPLARPLVLDNLRKLAAGTPRAKQSAQPPLDVSKLVGEDLADEFSRRLVDAVDK